MQEQGSPSLTQLSSILIASGPQDERAIALVQTLRDAGLRVIFAENVALAARASEAAACVAVLRPDTWKAQTIATIMRSKPDCLIPVLAEAMALPRGPWTRPAIDLTTDVEQGEQEVVQLLRDYLATRSAPTRAQRKQSDLVPLDSVRILPLRPRRRRKRNTGKLITTLVLILAILGLGGLLGYHYYTHPPTTQLASSNLSSRTLTSVYTAVAPGPYCDNGGGQWEKGERYVKTEDKKKVEVLDKYTTLQCQSNGALVTRTGDYDVYSELFFAGPYGQGALAPHYLAQVDATIIGGDAQASVTMDTHIHSYGRYNFAVNTLGHWQTTIGDTISGASINRLALGFLPQAAKTYTLALDVYGPTMTFFINGIQVTTVTDTTYIDNDMVAFGINDSTTTSPVSARFSNFKYEALSAKLTSSQAIATATALAQSNAQLPYSARVPGYNCDKGAGQWQPLADLSNSGALLCHPGGMQLTEPANAKAIAEEDFYWLNGHFPQNYKVSTQVDVSAAAGSCAGITTRADTKGDNYTFIVCPDGSWAIVLNTDKFHTLAQGTIQPQNTYKMMAESRGSAQSLYIDGQLIQTVNDTHLTSTDHISLNVGLYISSQAASATFSNFTFTPLP
jgi:hypothetical protein